MNILYELAMHFIGGKVKVLLASNVIDFLRNWLGNTSTIPEVTSHEMELVGICSGSAIMQLRTLIAYVTMEAIGCM